MKTRTRPPVHKQRSQAKKNIAYILHHLSHPLIDYFAYFKTRFCGPSYAPGPEIWCGVSELIGKQLLLSKCFGEKYS